MSRIVTRANISSFGQKCTVLSVLPGNANRGCNQFHSICGNKRTVGIKSGLRYSSAGGVLKSPFGDVNVPAVSLPEFVWQDYEGRMDEQAAVSIFLSKLI